MTTRRALATWGLVGLVGLGAACSSSPDEDVPGAPGDGTGDPSSAPTGTSTSKPQSLPPTSKDGIKNGGETDVDCGGGEAPACGDGKKCGGGGDCTSLVCKGGACAAPAKDDGVKNGDESDVDCGGTTTGAPKCGDGKACDDDGDCAHATCDWKKTCAPAPSCRPHLGGDTCGAGEVGVGGAQHESCCISLPIYDDAVAKTYKGNAVSVDKYQVTAGRMRAFVKAVNGDLRAWVKAHPTADIPAGFEDALPSGMDWDPALNDGNDPTFYLRKRSAVWDTLGGPYLYNQAGTSGCGVGQPGTHSYWMDDTVQTTHNGEEKFSYSQDELDVKALNCANYLVLAAFCAWDGGRLPKIDELDYAWNKGDAATYFYPWGTKPVPKGFNNGGAVVCASPLPAGTTCAVDGDFAATNWNHSYQYPANKNTADYSYFISPPGRFPKNTGPFGHADLAGNLFDVTGTITTKTADPTTTTARWSRAGSWEGHTIPYSVHSSPLLRKYGKQGGRCAR